MSYLVQQETLCSHCQFPTQAELWSAINVKEDPELRDLLLGGELNLIECEACKEIFYAEHFTLYHDPAYELMVFVYPQSCANERAKWEEKTAVDFGLSQATLPLESQATYEPVTVFGMNELVLLVEDEEELAIQGQIVSIYSADHGFKVKKLSPALARRFKIPPVIPYVDGPFGCSRGSVLSALEKIHKVNDRLFVYEKLAERIKNDTAWNLPPEAVN